MSALNLSRLLVTRASALDATTTSAAASDRLMSLRAESVGRLRREVLEPLDGWLRGRMDALHAEIGAAERKRASADAIGQMRVSFTHLHVATDVAARTIEVCTLFCANSNAPPKPTVDLQ